MITNSPQQYKKRPRSDKGIILATPRDLNVLALAAHSHVVRVDHLRELLSQQAGGPLKNPETGLLAMSTVEDIIDRWRRAGWVAFHRVMAQEPAYLWVQKRGLEVVGLDELYRGRSPAVVRYHHYHCVLDVRLHWWWDQQDPEFRGVWLPERRLRAEATYVKNLPEDYATARIRLLKGPIPDAVMVGDDGGWVDAVEVQLTPLKPMDMEAKVERIMRAKYLDTYDDDVYVYDDVHFYVPSEAMKRHIERACSGLSDDEKERLNIYVDTAYQAFIPQ